MGAPTGVGWRDWLGRRADPGPHRGGRGPSRDDVCGGMVAGPRRRRIVGEPRRRQELERGGGRCTGSRFAHLRRRRRIASVLFAGTLEGVFRSKDPAATWKQISPPGSHEIHEIESLAVDPANPEIVYAGTWHLPWKTNDGGKTWHNIKQGVIDDSDVFSIIIDPEKPSIVYLSACSGIYKSENGGVLFRKIAGHSGDGAPDARAAAGSGASRNGLRRNHRGALQDHGRRAGPSSG